MAGCNAPKAHKEITDRFNSKSASPQLADASGMAGIDNVASGPIHLEYALPIWQSSFKESQDGTKCVFMQDRMDMENGDLFAVDLTTGKTIGQLPCYSHDLAIAISNDGLAVVALHVSIADAPGHEKTRFLRWDISSQQSDSVAFVAESKAKIPNIDQFLTRFTPQKLVRARMYYETAVFDRKLWAVLCVAGLDSESGRSKPYIVSPTGDTIAERNRNDVAIRSAANGAILAMNKGEKPDARISHLSFSQNGKTLLVQRGSASLGNLTTSLLDARSLRPLVGANALAPFKSVMLSRNADHLFVDSGNRGEVQSSIVNLSLQRIADFPSGFSVLQVSGDRDLVLGKLNERYAICNANDGSLICQLPLRCASAALLNGDERVLVSRQRPGEDKQFTQVWKLDLPQ